MMNKLTPVLLATLMSAFVGVVALHHEGDAAAPPAPARTLVPAPTTTAATAPAATPPATVATTQPALRRTLRTVALGWDLLAPGVLAGDKTRLDASFASATTVDELESALARGGGEATGADVAIMPLSTFVASYERLRALSPEIVFVVGWSRGREALYGGSVTALAHPGAGSLKLSAQSGSPESFLALFLLDMAGVPASRVELVAPRLTAPLSAVTRHGKEAGPGKLIVTSADTPYLMPIVAVAPHGFIASHTHELETWSRVWLDGVAKLQADVPTGARVVAGQPGAPPVVGIIESLGQLEFASLRDNAVASGLSGRGALTLDDAFRTTWRIWRDAGVLTTPAPETVPLYPGAIAALARADRAEAQQPSRTPASTSDSKRPRTLLVTYPSGSMNVDAWVARVGFVASVFDRLPLRVTIKDNRALAKKIADLARERYNLRPGHITAGTSATSSSIEVLAR